MSRRTNNRRVVPIVLVALVLVLLGMVLDWTPSIHAGDVGAADFSAVVDQPAEQVAPLSRP